VERPLRRPDDYVRFAGQKAKLKLRSAVAGQKVLVGQLGAVASGLLTLEDGAKSYSVPLDDVVSARLVFEFGPAPKPVTSAKKKRRV
jgi:ribosome maturation factor RimP